MPAFGSKKKTAKVPATVKLDGKTYKVTAVAPYAFVGYDNLSSVLMGKYVKKIGKGAFSGCKKLSTLTIRSKKLDKSGVKRSLEGSFVAKIIVPQKKVKAYRKLFTKKNAGSKEKVSVAEKHPAKS